MKKNAKYDTRPAAADISLKIHHFVKRDASNQFAAITAATDIPAGVLDNKPDAAGKAAEAVVEGEATVLAGAAVTAGVKIQSNDAGRAIALASGGHSSGIAITAASLDGDPIQVQLTIGGGQSAP